MPAPSSRLNRTLWDWVGIVATALCALHCLMLPLLLPILALGGLGVIADPVFEHAVLAATALLAAVVLWHGYRRHHGRALPLVLAAIGVLLYAVRMQFGTAVEPLVLSLGAGCVVGAHLLNLRFARDHKIRTKALEA